MCSFYLFQEIDQQQPVAQSTAAMKNDSLDVESPPAAKASFFKETTCTTPRASLSTTFDLMVPFREALAAEYNAYLHAMCRPWRRSTEMVEVPQNKLP